MLKDAPKIVPTLNKKGVLISFGNVFKQANGKNVKIKTLVTLQALSTRRLYSLLTPPPHMGICRHF